MMPKTVTVIQEQGPALSMEKGLIVSLEGFSLTLLPVNITQEELKSIVTTLAAGILQA